MSMVFFACTLSVIGVLLAAAGGHLVAQGYFFVGLMSAVLGGLLTINFAMAALTFATVGG